MALRIRLFESSSTKLAIFFSSLLLLALILLSVEVYSLSHGARLHPLFSQFILALIIIISVGLFLISFYVTKRINTIVDTADRVIATRDLSQRFPVDSRWDDLSKLSAVLNSMLGEIEQSVSSVRQVSDNIAHDLRTPLTRLRNHLETIRDDAATGNLPRTAQRDQFNGLIHECDALLATFNALLRIANIESGRRTAGFHQVNIASVLRDVLELYEPLATEKHIQLLFRAVPVTVMGDKDLLFQAIANLLDNAIKYTPAEGTVIITAEPHEQRARVVISDSGVGIADAHKEHVFRRFYRVEQSRHLQGSGLGLSLVAAIVALHQGSITLSDRMPNGLTVTVLL